MLFPKISLFFIAENAAYRWDWLQMTSRNRNSLPKHAAYRGDLLMKAPRIQGIFAKIGPRSVRKSQKQAEHPCERIFLKIEFLQIFVGEAYERIPVALPQKSFRSDTRRGIIREIPESFPQKSTRSNLHRRSVRKFPASLFKKIISFRYSSGKSAKESPHRCPKNQFVQILVGEARENSPRRSSKNHAVQILIEKPTK